MARLGPIQKRKIKEAYKDGITVRELALIFKVSVGTINNVLHKETRSKQEEIADRQERFLGGLVPDDGCYVSVPKNSEYNHEPKRTPESQIDRNDPLSILIAIEEFEGE